MHTISWIGSCAREKVRLGAILVAFMICAAPCWAASAKDNFLDSILPEFDGTRGNAFEKLCRMLDRGCGMELLTPSNLKKGVKLKPSKNETLTPREILEAYVLQNSSYRWIFRDDVLNLEPIERGGEDLLSRKLDSVSIHGVSGLKAALDVLHQAEIGAGYSIMGRPPRFSVVNLELKDTTVREALNAIVKADGQIIWVFRLPKAGGEGMLSMRSWRKSGISFSKEERKKVKWPEKKSKPKKQ